MKLNIDNIKSMDNIELYTHFIDCIEEVFEEYRDLNISKEKYQQIVMNEINKSKTEYNGKKPYNEYLSDKIAYQLFLIADESLDKEGFYDNETNRNDTDIYDIYSKDLSTMPIITPEEEKQLGYEILKGNKEALNKLVESNLRLVAKIAKSFRGRGLAYMDLIQEGNLGLITAAKQFDVTKGFRFTTYAFIWIRQYIRRAIDNQGRSIRLPVHISENIIKYKSIYNKLCVSLNREPTDIEVSEEMKLPLTEIEILKNYDEPITSLNFIVKTDNTEGDGKELENFVLNAGNVTEDTFMKEHFQYEIRDLLSKCNLTTREMMILEERYGFNNKKPKSHEKVAAIFGVTRQRIRQIEERALLKIRFAKNIADFSVYLDNPTEGKNRLQELKKKKYKQANFYYPNTSEN